MSKRLSALLVDPALFTPPYDAALTHGLELAGVRVRWAARAPRAGEPDFLTPDLVAPIYYRGVEETSKRRGPLWKMRKALSHLQAGPRLIALAARESVDVVHFQWMVLPLYDGMLMRSLARSSPIVLTLHDLSPFNNAPTSRLQVLGFQGALRAATRLIVHTEAARTSLIRQGHAAEKVVHIPHGALELQAAFKPEQANPADGRWCVVLFGKLQPYKGADTLIEALGRLSLQNRARLKVIVAGEPFIPTRSLTERTRALGLEDTVEFRFGRLDETDMARLFAAADCFVFPYRQIDASGVLHLVLPFGRWIIASDLGAFRDCVIDEVNGRRVPVDAPDALAAALLESIGRKPDPEQAVCLPGWDEIGRRTRAVYEEAADARGRAR